jgi:hypothetical protein
VVVPAAGPETLLVLNELPVASSSFGGQLHQHWRIERMASSSIHAAQYWLAAAASAN